MSKRLEKLEGRAARVAHLVRIREEALLELNEMLGPEEAELEEIEQDDPTTPREKALGLKAERTKGTAMEYTIYCKKCERVKHGGDKRGRHSKGCRYANGPVTETIVKELPEEIPLEGVVAEYRSRCCQERVIQKGSTLECFKCGNRTEPYQPKPPEKKWFDCDGCGNSFEADTSDVVHCTQCGGSDVWPKKV